MTAAEYANVYKRYAEFLRGGKPFRIATGPAGDDYAWTDTLMRQAGRMIDGIDLHNYTVARTWASKGRATEFTEEDWLSAVQKALRMDTLITRHSTIMDRYDPARRVWLIVGEWGMWHDPEPGSQPGFLYQQNALRDAVVAGLHLNIFNQHAERVRMANIAQTVNVLQSMILTKGEQMILTPTYWVFDMYKVHQDATLLPLYIRSDSYSFGGQSVQAVSASASKDKAGAIHITLVNVDPSQPRTLQADIRGVKVSAVSGRVLTAATMQAHNTFEQPAAVQPVAFTGARLSGGMLKVELPSKSVVVLELR
jgi:alpha-N-arabinofuranosidase